MATSSLDKKLENCTKHQANMKSDSYSEKLLANLKLMKSQDVLCDYCLIAEGQEFKVHKNIMIASSEYFRALLMGGMRESKEEKAELKGLTSSGLSEMVNFAYSGSFNVTVDNLDEVLHSATHLQMPEAVELCCQFIEGARSVENCVDMLKLTEVYSLNDSRDQLYKFIVTHFEDVNLNEYLKLTSEQLLSLLKENTLKVQSEGKLFDLVIKWVYHDQQERQTYMGSLMRNVRLPLLSGEELVEKVSLVDLMRNDPGCHYLLEEAKNYNLAISRQPVLQNRRTQIRSDKKSFVYLSRDSRNMKTYDPDTRNEAVLRDVPVKLQSPCVAVLNNFMYVCGGSTVDIVKDVTVVTSVSAKCFRYDPRFNTWLELAAMSSARNDFVMVAHDDVLYAIGGQDKNDILASVEAFSIAKNKWEAKSPLGVGLCGHAGAYLDGRIYVSGGCDDDITARSTVQSYHVATNVWRGEPPLSNVRKNHAMVECSGKLYVLGGHNNNPEDYPWMSPEEDLLFEPAITIETFSPSTRTWTVCRARLNTRQAGVFPFEDNICVVGYHWRGHYISCKYNRALDRVTHEMDMTEEFQDDRDVDGRICCILTLSSYL